MNDLLLEIVKQHEIVTKLLDKSDDFTAYYDQAEKLDELMDKLRVELGIDPLAVDEDTVFELVEK